MNNPNEFQYTYSAKEQAELKRIREKYLSATAPSGIDKMTQLRRLDAKVTQKGIAFSLCIGVISSLLMGLGMSLVMTDMRTFFGMSSAMAWVCGIVIGLIGMAGVVSAYPLYQLLVARERKRIAPEILRLTEELMTKNS